MKTLALLLALADPVNDDLWARAEAAAIDSGVTRAMFDSVMLWVEGQYYLGWCNNHLSASYVAHYRTWWNDTGLVQSEFGRAMISSGDKQYQSGLDALAASQPTREMCSATISGWAEDLEATLK